MLRYKVSLENIKKAVKHPIRALDEVILEQVYRLPVTLWNSQHTIGTNIFDREWDVLIILDTCRVDAMQEVKNEYSFINDIDTVTSVGGSTFEWTARTFDKQHINQIKDTVLINGQNSVYQVLGEKQQQTNEKHLLFRALRFYPTVEITELKKHEPVFKYKRWGGQGPTNLTAKTPPRYVTERAIETSRQNNHDRLIIHYLQPHSPWVANALKEDRDLNEYEDDWWGYLTKTGDVETVWQSYLDDLRYVLDDIELLLENIAAEKVVISADHGEAFGEYGILGHKIGSIHPKIRKVPWVVTTGEDTQSYTPDTEEPTISDVSREELNRQLRALGYTS